MAVYRTLQIWVKKGHRMHPYFQNMCQNAKNMYNITNFYIRQIFTGLKQEKELQPLQKEVLESLQTHLPAINANQLQAYQKRSAKEQKKAKSEQKEIKCHLFEMPSKDKPSIHYPLLDALFKSMKQIDYQSLPIQSSQGIMRTVFQNWKAFYGSLREYKKNPIKFSARPNIPSYCRLKEKEVIFSNQNCVVKDNKFLKFPKTKLCLNIGKLGYSEGKLKQVRVIPKYSHYVVELVFQVPIEVEKKESKNRLLAVDLGIDNLATIVTNTGKRAVLVKGKNVKSVNQRFNQLKAYYTGILRQGKQGNEGTFTSKRLEQISHKRFLQIKDLFHKASFQIVKIALEEDIDTIIIGQNKDWKQYATMGKRNNQSFTSLPHTLLIQMITYKAEKQGITVLLTEESYTSKASFLDNDDIPVYGQKNKNAVFSGKRIKRGLYLSKKCERINADVNGAANIMRKVFKDAFHHSFSSIEALQRPLSLTIK
ncbi:RNA-guided endonuclease InsQ/TnpB family protein [Oceanobacillus sojae]|uniref:RNA-guided endonuclease InsQ/TnpB family protein n=1 Tax=Oceanobacillus sojae TaxID=582851 RepID=UPI0009886240|nr:RNA-guided endonuclease TnpB family protein [Oceanobacillus sojae]MCT1902186.1 RNA-guided endonuclease TnpB family protein [Oceanobacillus sojae]